MLTLDGSTGEGGGQVLRTALALSILTRTPFRLTKIRAGRGKPGLLRQHLACCQAACTISGAKAHGMELGSSTLEFHPGPAQPGAYHFAIGSAGSTMLVLQTIALPLALAGGTSTLVLEGGTHNPAAPPVPFIQRVWLPVLARMGVSMGLDLRGHGFYPAGGGSVEVTIHPADKLEPVNLHQRGAIVRREARALVSNLPQQIAQREIKALSDELGLAPGECHIESVRSPGPGNALLLYLQGRDASELITGFGEQGLSSETVAARAAAKAREWLDADVPVGEHLADQLLIPMALAGGGSFRTLPLSGHTQTNMELIERFLPVRFQATGSATVEVKVHSHPAPRS